MKRAALFASVAVFCLAGTAQATEFASKEQCLKTVEEVKKIQASTEFPKIGDKAQKLFDDIVVTASGHCESGNYRDADQLLIVARSMIATE